MKKRSLRAVALSLSLCLTGCASSYAKECSLAQQMAAVFVSSLMFANSSVDRIAQDAAGCNR